MKNLTLVFALLATSGALVSPACYAGPTSSISDTGAGGGEIINPAPIVARASVSAPALIAANSANSQNNASNQTAEMTLMVSRSSETLRRLRLDLARLFTGNAPEVQALVAALEKTEGLAQEAGSAFELLSNTSKPLTLPQLNVALRSGSGLRANLKEVVGALKAMPKTGATPEQLALFDAALDSVAELTILMESLGSALEATRNQVVSKKTVRPTGT